jgi:acetolactate synthase small subunit
VSPGGKHQDDPVEPAKGGTVNGGNSTLELKATRHVLRLRLVHHPGVLTGVVQVFAALGIELEELTLKRAADQPDHAHVRCILAAEARLCDLACRKLSRLLDVLDLELQVQTPRMGLDHGWG